MTPSDLTRLKQYVAQLHEHDKYQYVLKTLQTELDHDPKPGLVKALAEALVKWEER